MLCCCCYKSSILSFKPLLQTGKCHHFSNGHCKLVHSTQYVDPGPAWLQKKCHPKLPLHMGCCLRCGKELVTYLHDQHMSINPILCIVAVGFSLPVSCFSGTKLLIACVEPASTLWAYGLVCMYTSAAFSFSMISTYQPECCHGPTFCAALYHHELQTMEAARQHDQREGRWWPLAAVEG